MQRGSERCLKGLTRGSDVRIRERALGSTALAAAAVATSDGCVRARVCRLRAACHIRFPRTRFPAHVVVGELLSGDFSVITCFAYVRERDVSRVRTYVYMYDLSHETTAERPPTRRSAITRRESVSAT